MEACICRGIQRSCDIKLGTVDRGSMTTLLLASVPETLRVCFPADRYRAVSSLVAVHCQRAWDVYRRRDPTPRFSIKTHQTLLLGPELSPGYAPDPARQQHRILFIYPYVHNYITIHGFAKDSPLAKFTFPNLCSVIEHTDSEKHPFSHFSNLSTCIALPYLRLPFKSTSG